MIIKNKKLIASCRTAGRCAACSCYCKKREAAHLFGKGAGGSDLKCNLVCLGSTRERCCQCHSTVHAANSDNGLRPNNSDLWQIVAKREGCTVEELREAILFIFRLDKAASPYKIVELMMALSPAAKRIVTRELSEAGKINAEAA